ncbi:MAG: YecA family protein [Aquificaceae bacterium]|nr:MAG: YecA family protein [Aquificaceae bacterium]
MEFTEIQNRLIEANAINDVAESHAIATGMLAANTAADKLTWIKQVMGEIEESTLPPADVIKSLGDWFEEIKTQLQDSGLRFELCLPDDDEPLAKRIAALQEWCRGFIFGIAMSGVKDFGRLPEDTRDLLTDFSRIGAEEEFDIDDIEESEASYADISQYVRIGVLLINEELQPMEATSTIH